VKGTLQSAKYVDIDDNGNSTIEDDEHFVKQIKVNNTWYDLAFDDVTGNGVYNGYYSIDNGKQLKDK
jgi:hypothetical protein